MMSFKLSCQLSSFWPYNFRFLYHFHTRYNLLNSRYCRAWSNSFHQLLPENCSDQNGYIQHLKLPRSQLHEMILWVLCILLFVMHFLDLCNRILDSRCSFTQFMPSDRIYDLLFLTYFFRPINVSLSFSEMSYCVFAKV